MRGLAGGGSFSLWSVFTETCKREKEEVKCGDRAKISLNTRLLVIYGNTTCKY